jgi:DNA-binding beta-propeller fold protein YncE
MVLLRDIPLPGSLPNVYRAPARPLAPGVAAPFDHFDFQALDPQTHLLFIAHTGPNPDKEQLVNRSFNPDTDAKTDGNIVVFDTRRSKVVRILDIPQVTGVVAAPDLGKVYANDNNDDTVYAIDEKTFKAVPIHLQKNDGPDGIDYDAQDHVIFVSSPGSPVNPDQSNVIERKNQNVTAINALTDRVIARIPLGIDGQWGDDVGHVRYDPVSHRVFVVVQQVPDPDDPSPDVLPPAGTARLVAIDPVRQRVLTRVRLPAFCFTPHGLAIDAQHQIAFVACVDTDPASLVRVDLQTMNVMAEPPYPLQVKPDLVVLDRPAQLLYVGCAVGITVFKVQGRQLQWLGNYTFGVNTHTLAVDPVTHTLYAPVAKLGNRPVLRLLHFDAAHTPLRPRPTSAARAGLWSRHLLPQWRHP